MTTRRAVNHDLIDDITWILSAGPIPLDIVAARLGRAPATIRDQVRRAGAHHLIPLMTREKDYQR